MGIIRRLAQNVPPSSFSTPLGPTPSSSVTGPPTGIGVPAGATGSPPGIPTSGGMPPDTANQFGGDSSQHGLPVNMNEKGHDIMIGITTWMVVFCVATVGGRLISRRIIKHHLGADDYVAISALVLFLGLAAEQYSLAHYGTIMKGPPSEKIRTLRRLVFSSQLTYTFVMLTARLSILLLYKRIFSLRSLWFRIAWWFCISLTTIYGLALSLLHVMQCFPHAPSSLWENDQLCQAFQKSSAETMGFLNAVIDMAILVLPIRMTWELQMSRKRKWAVSSIFGLGLMYVHFNSPSSLPSPGTELTLFIQQRRRSLPSPRHQPHSPQPLQ